MTLTVEKINALFESCGYKKFTDSFKEGPAYITSWQYRYCDSYGTRYFINVSVWDFNSSFPSAPIGVKLELDVQFHTEHNMEGDAINITRTVKSPKDAETKCAEIWKALNCGYYERYLNIQWEIQ
jgi:hypothetical protein